MGKEKKEEIVVASESLGSLLREYREIAGNSVAQMAETLCLSEETLVNLENEELKTLPEPPYVRGYLRNYAKLADKDPAILINSYESLRGADPSDLDYHFKTKPTILADSKKTISPVMGQLLLLSLLLLFIGGISMIPAVNKWITNTWNDFSDQTRQQSNFNNQDLMGAMPIPTPLGTEENTNKSNTPTNTADDSKNKANNDYQKAEKTGTDDKTQASTETTKPADTAQQSTQANEPLTDSQTPLTNDEIRIKLLFNMEVWMKIQDGTNKTVFEALNAAGSSKDLTLKKPLHFRVGNAQGLSLFVDDKAVDISSYIKGSVAKFTLE